MVQPYANGKPLGKPLPHYIPRLVPNQVQVAKALVRGQVFDKSLLNAIRSEGLDADPFTDPFNHGENKTDE